MELEQVTFPANGPTVGSVLAKPIRSLLLAVFVAGLLPTFGLAQGTVNFGSTDPVNHRVLSVYWNYSPMPVGSIVYLSWSPDGIIRFTRIATNAVGTNGWIVPSVIATTGKETPPGTSAWFRVSVDYVNGYGSGQTPDFLNPTGNPSAPAELSGWTSPLFAACAGFPGLVFIRSSPANKFVVAGDALTLSVDACASCWLSSPWYQWYNSHGAISGATNSSYVINPVQPNHADDYWVVVFTSFFFRTSAVATVTVLSAGSFAIETRGETFGVRSNKFGFNITGPTNLNVVVEACTNLANATWSPVQTNTLTTGVSYFSDPQWTNLVARFYRLRWP